MTDSAPLDRALHALDQAHRKRLRFLYEGLCTQIDAAEKPQIAATHFRKGLENAEAAYLLAKDILADVFGDGKAVI